MSQINLKNNNRYEKRLVDIKIKIREKFPETFNDIEKRARKGRDKKRSISND